MKYKVDRNLIKEGYISERKHPEFDYYIYNYTAKTQYEQMWNEQTLNCRGLILDGQGNVIAKPFSKFFNIGEYSEHSFLGKLPNWKYFDVFNKMDGSLGILYTRPDGKYSIATRGSFESEQATVATEIWNEKYNFVKLGDNYTFLFEIIYPENQIVVDYKDMKDLVLLAIIHKETGEELGYEDLLKFAQILKCPITEYYGRKSYNINAFKKLGAEIPEGAEGFVLRFDNGLRVKIKSDEYKRLHRLITGVSNKSIWELLKEGQDVDELLNQVPDEFYAWVKQTKEDLQCQYYAIEKHCQQMVGRACLECNSRKEVAELFKEQRDYMGVAFAIWDDKPYEHIIWKMLKPKYSKPFREDM